MIRFFANRPFQIAMGLLILVAAVLLRLTEPRLVTQLQTATFDTYNRLVPRQADPETSPVVIVDLDDESLTRIGQWPWPRTDVARMIERLIAEGASAVVFDIVFAEPDRTSPSRVAARLENDPSVTSDARRILAALPDHDAILSETIAEAGKVVTGFTLNPTGIGREPSLRVSWALAARGADVTDFVKIETGAIANLPELSSVAAGNGHFSLNPELDTVIRRVPLLLGYGHDGAEPKLYPALALEALRVAKGETTLAVRASAEEGITELRVAGQTVPLARDGSHYVYYAGSQPGRYLPVWQVLEDAVPEGRLDGKIALVGTSAPGLLDLRSTPLNASIAGVEVHAEIIEQIVAGEFLQRPFWIEIGGELAFILLVGLLLIITAPFLGPASQAAAMLVLIGGAFGLSWWAFTGPGFLVDPVYPSLSVLAIYLAVSLIGFMATEYERGVVRDAFGRYIAPDLVEDLAKHPDKLRLGGEVKDLSIMFTDIRGFTSISEQYDPESLTKLINDFLTPMSSLVLEYRGCIDKYMGDAMMAFWNAPIDDPDHAAHAIDAGLQMMAALEPLNERLKEEAEASGRKYLPLKTGIGINTGPCCVGNMGSEQRFAYSALGDAVNLASRLEGQTKGYGVDVLIGEVTERLVPDYATVECDMIRVKGKLEPVTVYAVLGRPDTAAEDWFQQHRAIHQAMLDAYRGQDWDAAEAAIAKAQPLVPGDKLAKLYDLYRERIAEYRAAPPPADWDGVFVATSK